MKVLDQYHTKCPRDLEFSLVFAIPSSIRQLTFSHEEQLYTFTISRILDTEELRQELVA
jgi:hypothetical protein